jgi:osmotically-inducible protein OsmY
MRANTKLQKAVLAELEWDPRVDASKVGVATVDGVVTLTGSVPSYAEKIAAEQAVKRVAGVKGIANDLEVHLPGMSQRGDTELAQAALQALKWDVTVPAEVTVRISHGWVTLEGTVEHEFQRAAAERAVRHLRGLRGCDNNIELRPPITENLVKHRIEAALQRRAELDASQVKVEVAGSLVTLKGRVHSWREHDDAFNAAWDAAGVTAVVDALDVDARRAPARSASAGDGSRGRGSEPR